MTRRRKIGIACLVLVVGVGGIISVIGLGADGPQTASDSSTGDGGKAPQEAGISVLPGQLNSTASNRMTMQVRVDIRVRGYGTIQYRDIQLCAYARNGTLLQRKTLGNITTDPPREFVSFYRPRLTVQTRPKYIIVDHPHLRNDSRFYMDTRYWQGDGYRLSHEALSEVQDRFEWPRTNEAGRCG